MLLGRGLREKTGILNCSARTWTAVITELWNCPTTATAWSWVRELAEAGRALLRRAGVVLDDQLDLPPAEDAAARVHVLGAHLGAADDELSGGRVAGRRERREDADLHRLLGQSRRR